MARSAERQSESGFIVAGEFVPAIHPVMGLKRPRRAAADGVSKLFRVFGGGGLSAFLIAVLLGITPGLVHCQDDPLNQIHVQPPAAKGALPDPKAANPAGDPSLASRATARVRVDVNLVLVPVTVTDPLNRLVTGLEKQNFFLFENNAQQTIKSFSSEDAPVSIGIIFDLSGSMTNKIDKSRDSVLAMMRTANPQDEFFVIGFNDRPELMVDFTNSVDDIAARMVMLHPGKRTALLDAIYFGVSKMKMARYERKALIIVSDGGDNRSRYTEREVRTTVREADVQLYAIGLFDKYAATPEERDGPILLSDLCNETGGRMFQVDDLNELDDIASKIGAELRNQYVLGYNPQDAHHDGKWRKVKVKLVAPQGLPPLTLHARSGYYAPSQ